jgi:hypothetical protein
MLQFCHFVPRKNWQPWYRTSLELGIGSGVLVIRWGDDDYVSKNIHTHTAATCMLLISGEQSH